MISDDNSCLAVENVTIVPFQDGSYAAYRSDGTFIPESQVIRSYGNPFKVAPLPLNSVEDSREVIFAGFIFKHYGHFLLEGLARLLYAKENPDIPICWVGFDGLILDFQEAIFKLLGLTNQIVFADRNVRFAKVHFPKPGFIIQGIFYPWHADFLGQYPAPGDNSKKFGKIYLSRSHFLGDSCISNELELEKALEQIGVKIIYPEEHSLPSQLEILNQASDILAIEGSALHNLILLKEVQANVVIIPRVGTYQNLNYNAIASTKWFKQCYLPYSNLYTTIQPIKKSHVNFTGILNIQKILSYIDIESWDPYSLYSNVYTKYPEILSFDPDHTKESITKLTEENQLLKAKFQKINLEYKKLLKYFSKSKQ